MRVLILALVLMIELLASSPISAEAQEIPVNTSLGQLYGEYKANEIAADQKYKGKVLQISGDISKVGRDDASGEPYIELNSGLASGSIRCYFNAGKEPELALLQKAEIVVIQGTCAGMVSNPQGLSYVKLQESSLISASPTRTTSGTTPKSGCFIVTAVYGTEQAPEIEILREFRDKVLLHNSFGTSFVDTYYGVSPPVAQFISRYDWLRALIREVLIAPIISLVKFTHGWWSTCDQATCLAG